MSDEPSSDRISYTRRSQKDAIIATTSYMIFMRSIVRDAQQYQEPSRGTAQLAADESLSHLPRNAYSDTRDLRLGQLRVPSMAQGMHPMQGRRFRNYTMMIRTTRNKILMKYGT